MSERQIIPIEGDSSMTNAEKEAPRGVSGFKKIAGVAAIAGAAMLHPEAANAQSQNQDRQQRVERVDDAEAKAIKKMQGWLEEIAADYPALQGASIHQWHGEGDSVTLAPFERKDPYTVSLKDSGGKYPAFLVIKVERGGMVTLTEFVEAIISGLKQAENQRARIDTERYRSFLSWYFRRNFKIDIRIGQVWVFGLFE